MGPCCGSSNERGAVNAPGKAAVKGGKKAGAKLEPPKPRPPPPSWIGHRDKKLVKDYTLGNQLGQGAYGEVRECTHKISGIKRAVKILRKVRMDDKEKANMINEIENLENLDHPNILKLHESNECEKRYYIVTDICKGGELFDEITKNKHFTESNAG